MTLVVGAAVQNTHSPHLVTLYKATTMIYRQSKTRFPSIWYQVGGVAHCLGSTVLSLIEEPGHELTHD